MNWRGFRVAGWIGAGALAVGLVISLVRQDERAITYMARFLVFTLAFLLLVSRRVPAALTGVFTFSMLVNTPGWAWRWLDTVFLYDEAAHLLTTTAVTAPACLLLYRPLRRELRAHPFVFSLAIVTFGMANGVVWEIYEWISDHFVIPPGTMDITDTMDDLIADGLGALLAVPLGIRALRAWEDVAAGRP